MPEVFLSYSQSDRTIAEALVGALTDLGVHVWWDAHIQPGREWAEQISDALARADAAVLLVTPASLQSTSAAREWQQAIASTRRILPIVAGGADYADLPPQLAHIQALHLPGEGVTAMSNVLGRLADFVRSVAELTPSTAATGSRAVRVEYIGRPFTLIQESLAATTDQVDLSADSFDGLLSPLPGLLEEVAARAVRVRIVLPDPNFFGDPSRGRSFEIAARSEIALARLRNVGSGIAIRLVTVPVSQTMLRVDRTWFIDPLPTSPSSHGFLRFRRGRRPVDLFEASSKSFESLFMSGRPATDHTTDSGVRNEVEELLESPREQDLERLAQLYFEHLGFETAGDARVGRSEVDLLMWDPTGGPPAIAEVKRSKGPVSAHVIDQLIETAISAGAKRAYLVTDQPITAAGADRLRELGSALEVAVLTSEVMSRALRERRS